MPQTNSRFFDDLSRLMTDAAGLADGARREAQTFARSQLERMMSGMDLVSREEFEAVREMAAQGPRRERQARRPHRGARGEAGRAKALTGREQLPQSLDSFRRFCGRRSRRVYDRRE